jgi:hypothetical protein
VKLAGQRGGCLDLDVGVFMGYLNKTCSSSGPVLRLASNSNTWNIFTFTKVGKSAEGEELVQIETFYPTSSNKPR